MSRSHSLVDCCAFQAIRGPRITLHQTSTSEDGIAGFDANVMHARESGKMRDSKLENIHILDFFILWVKKED